MSINPHWYLGIDFYYFYGWIQVLLTIADLLGLNVSFVVLNLEPKVMFCMIFIQSPLWYLKTVGKNSHTLEEYAM